jgi:hypothetical protein
MTPSLSGGLGGMSFSGMAEVCPVSPGTCRPRAADRAQHAAVAFGGQEEGGPVRGSRPA